MKLFPPEEQVRLYEEGFGDSDLLNRRSTGKVLSDLLERIEDPLVVALDGAWGCGKSYFLRRWVGAHARENGGDPNTVTIYFDAFAHDFLDDPLTSIAGAINDRIPQSEGTTSKLRTAVARLAKPATRVGLALATAGISEITGDVLDAVLNAAADEAKNAVDEFWKREESRRQAIKDVHAALRQITSPEESTRKLIIVVDELDRCRPDFALATLEVLKHFFAVSNVHFILGVNLNALEHSVTARYGTNIDAEAYLRRFISLSIKLPDHLEDGERRSSSIVYFQHAAREMELPGELTKEIRRQLELPGISNTSLRDINKVLSRIALVPRENRLHGYQVALGSLILVKVLNPRLYGALRAGTANLDAILDFFGITPTVLDSGDYESSIIQRTAKQLVDVWAYILNPDSPTNHAFNKEEVARLFNSWGDRLEKGAVDRIARDLLETIHIPQ